jgi:hypothetical protein
MTTLDTPPATSRTTSDWRPVAALSLGLIALLTVFVTAFAWPPSELEPRDLPLAVAGDPQVVAGLGEQLTSSLGADAVDVVEVDDRAAAVAAIEDREAYGALVAGPEGPEILVASGAGPVVAQLLEQATPAIAAATGSAPTVTDVVPLAAGDPRGAIFNAAALPLALGGIVIGAATSLALRRTRQRVATAFVVAVASGLTLTGVLQGWLDALGGSYWANAGVVTLGILAVALPIVGLRHLVGPAGIGVVALLVLLVGNPLSGVTSAPELVPLGWLGQLLPPGATGTALRGTAYFDGAGTPAALLVLSCWALAGLALTLVPREE